MKSAGFRRCAVVTLPRAGGAATLRRSGGKVALRGCDAARLPGAGDAVALRRCRWASDAAALLTLLTLRRYDAAKLGRCCGAFGAVDAATLRRGCGSASLLALRRCDAARQARRCDAVGAATLPSAIAHAGWLCGLTR